MIPTPSIFQLYCGFLASFEIPIIISLLQGSCSVVEAGPWFDDKYYYRNNRPLAYVYSGILMVLVLCRAMMCWRPKLRLLIIYATALHLLEVMLYSFLLMNRVQPVPRTAYLFLVLTIFNTGLFLFRFVKLESAAAKGAVESLSWRKEQLAIIRQKRAAYANQKKSKKDS